MKKKKITYPIHKMGKYYGYEEYEDGSIKIAPQYSQQIDDSLLKKTSINEILKSVTEQCSKLLISVIKEQTHFWDSIKEDYGLDYEKYQYFYDGCTKTIKRKEKVQEQEKQT